MRNAPHVVVLLGKIFGLTGLIGTVLMIAVFFILPPERRQIAFCASVFPCFLIMGSYFFFIGKKGVANNSLILSKGIKLQAKFTKFLRYGARPVRRGSIYGAEVEFDYEGEHILSQVFFYGADHKKVSQMLKEKQSVEIVYLSDYPKRVLFSEGS